MDICKTDTITRYLLDAATLYDGIDTTTAYNRARLWILGTHPQAVHVS